MPEEDLWYFKHNGSYRVPQSLPEDLIRRLNAATDTQIEQMIEPIVWEEGTERSVRTLRRLSKILDRDPVYLEVVRHALVVDALEGILGPHIELLTNKHNHLMVRPPDSGPVFWHSGEEPYDMPLVTALIYLEESTLENGCIRMVPGSHMRPFRQPRRPKVERFRDCDFYYRSLPVPMPRGGILLFNDCCFHGADANLSCRSRRSMTLAYRAHDAHDVVKEDPEKILVRGERIYTGHPFPRPSDS